MLIKAGVDISRLARKPRYALGVLADLLEAIGLELVITSTFEGAHGAGSLHYANCAFDIRLPLDRAGSICADAMRKLGNSYQIIIEKNHIHVEYDPPG